MICAHHKLMERADRAMFLVIFVIALIFFERIKMIDSIWIMSLLGGSQITMELQIG